MGFRRMFVAAGAVFVASQPESALAQDNAGKLKDEMRQQAETSGETAFPGDLFNKGDETAFPGDLFDQAEAMQTQVEWMLERVRKGKTVRAAYQADSTFRKELASLEELANQASSSLGKGDRALAAKYAGLTEELGALSNASFEGKDLEATERWLVATQEALESIAVLRKKQAR